jgi:hypothetical protein
MIIENKENLHDKNIELPKNFLYKLKAKWGVDNIYQVLIILLVFSLTGSTVVFFRKSLFLALGFNEDTAFWIKTITYIAFIFPSYQILILVYGFIFGQFDFFWQKEKKMLRAFGRLFGGSKK